MTVSKQRSIRWPDAPYARAQDYAQTLDMTLAAFVTRLVEWELKTGAFAESRRDPEKTGTPV